MSFLVDWHQVIEVYMLFILKICNILSAAAIIIVIISIPKLISTIFLHAVLHCWPTFHDLRADRAGFIQHISLPSIDLKIQEQ